MHAALRSIFLLSCLVLAWPARAATFCADSAAGIAQALDSAENNGQADDIRIVSGSYVLANGLVLSTHEAFGVSISGRWNPDCSAQTGAVTALDGNNAVRILYVSSDADSALAVTDLYFTRGDGAAAPGGGALTIETSARSVVIERNFFIGNRTASGSAGAARVAVSTSDSRVTVRNNVVLGNSAPEGAGFVVNASIGNAYVTGNTIVANTATIAGALCGGLCIAGASDFEVSNNILWSNTGADLHIGNTGSALLFFNDIDAMSGSPPGGEGVGNVRVEPGFAPGLLNLQLAPDSPLVNRGGYRIHGGVGDLDAARAPRHQGITVDIGAYETDVLLRDSFDGAGATSS